MALDFEMAMAAGSRDQPYSYTDVQTMLYALSIGMARDLPNEQELQFVFEKDLCAVPTMGTVAAWGARDVRTLGVDYSKVLHGEQKLTLHKPLPVAADVLVDTRTKGIYDKGKDKGALIVSEIAIRLADDGDPLCTLETTHFARGDGGFSEAGGDSGRPAPPHSIPDRPADHICHMKTTISQPLYYRLLGDRNVLHADPKAAEAAGFDRPILHGLCTYGICCHAVLKTICNYDPAMITQFDVRFSSPVFPGETLVVKMWADDAIISFRARSLERDIVVINNGRCIVAG